MQQKYAQYVGICKNMHAKICKNMDSICKKLQQKFAKYAVKYAKYAEVHILHISYIYALPTLLMLTGIMIMFISLSLSLKFTLLFTVTSAQKLEHSINEMTKVIRAGAGRRQRRAGPGLHQRSGSAYFCIFANKFHAYIFCIFVHIFRIFLHIFS